MLFLRLFFFNQGNKCRSVGEKRFYTTTSNHLQKLPNKIKALQKQEYIKSKNTQPTFSNSEIRKKSHADDLQLN